MATAHIAIAIPPLETLKTPELRDEQIVRVVSKFEELKAQAEQLQVVDQSSAEIAVESASIAAKTLKWLEVRRDAAVRPKNEEVTRINQEFKLFSEPLEVIKKHFNDALLTYKAQCEKKDREAKAERDRLQREAEEKQRQEAIERQRIADELRKKELEEATANNVEAPPPLIMPEPEVVQLPVAPAPEAPKSFTSVTGSASFRKTWKCKVIDKKEFVKACLENPNLLITYLIIDETGLNRQAAEIARRMKMDVGMIGADKLDDAIRKNSFQGTEFYIHETPVNS